MLQAYPELTKMSLDGRYPLKTSPTGALIRDNSIQNMMKTPMTKKETKTSKAQIRRILRSGL
jgi:hypothetical protein